MPEATTAVTPVKRSGRLRDVELVEELPQQVHQPDAESDQRDEIPESARRRAQVLQRYYERQAASGGARREAGPDQRDSHHLTHSALRSGHAGSGAQVKLY